MEAITVRLEIDVAPSERGRYSSGYEWVGEDAYDGLTINVLPARGHGFGLTEIVDAVIAFGGTVGAGVSVNLVTEALKLAVKGTVRRAHARRADSSIPVAEEDEEFDVESTSIESTVRDVLDDVHSSPN
jgi:hypothetical protein